MTTLLARPRAIAREDVLDLLRRDHQHLRRDLAEFDRMAEAGARQACQRLVQRTLARLKVHADVEEHLFYPAAVGLMRHAEEVEQCRADHRRLDRLIDEIEQLEPTRPRWQETFQRLGALLSEHMAEEEDELFPQLPKAGVAWDRLHAQMLRRHREGAEDLGVTD